MAKKFPDPFKFMDDFRGKDFKGEWPTVPEMFSITVKRFPNNKCFTDFEGEGGSKQTLTYTQANDNILKLAKWMVSKGIVHGDRVAVSGKNSPEWATVYLAALFAGAIICPIDYALHNKEIENLLNTAKPKLFFVDADKFPAFSEGKYPYKVFSLSPKFEKEYVYNLSTTKNNLSEVIPAVENDTAAILFTSGTTGNPKGVMLSHKNLVSDTYIAQTRMEVLSTDVFYAILPIHHAYTMTAVFLESISTGAEIVFGKSLAVAKLMKELKEGQITMLLGVPLLFNKLLSGIMKGIRAKGAFVYGIIKFLLAVSYLIKKLTGLNPGKSMFKAVLKQANIYSLRIAISGGGPLAPSVFKVYNELGIDFVQGYGLTETAPIITLNPVAKFKIQSVGQYFYEYMDMKILNPDEKGVGEVAVKGPMVMQGYYQMPEETEKVFTEDGYFKTGDLGWLDKDNYLMLSGRAKNMIVTAGGKNVYPEEIENAFQLCTDINQITIQGYQPDKRSQAEEIEALIYPSDDLFTRLKIKRDDKIGGEAIKKEIQANVDKINRELQSYQRISKVTILEAPLEMTSTQKVKRNYNKK